MHLQGNARRSSVDLAIAMAAAAALVVLNLAVNCPGRLHAAVDLAPASPAVRWTINLLFFWLAVALWLAFMHWRRSAHKVVEFESVISGISPDALVVIRPDRRIVMCNDSVQRIFGYTPQEVLGQDTSLLYRDRRTTGGSPREIYESLDRDGFHIGTATGRRKDGAAIPLEIITGHLSGRDGAVLLMRDITERLWMEEERRRLDARARQWEKLESLGLLAGGIAHDFNNVLTVVRGHTELLQMVCKTICAECDAPTGKIVAERVQPSLEEIGRAADRAREMCERLLTFSGKGSVHCRPMNLSNVTAETGQMLDAALSRRAAVRYQLSCDLPFIKADVTQMRQVVMNLMKNAVEALPADGGTVTVTTGVREFSEAELQDAVLPGAQRAGRHVYLQVSDSGCGMDEETRKQIFAPFFTTKEKSGGHGMGLAAVMGAVRGHGGALKLESAPGKGSTFTVLLPCPDAAPGA